MFIPALLLAMVPILLAPVEMVKITLEAKQWELKQVNLDNILIALGKKDRALFQFVARVNQELSTTENRHHPYHTCAKIPYLEEICDPPDQIYETGIQLLTASSLRYMQMEWQKNSLQFQLQTHALSPLARNERPDFPFELKRCPFCGLDNHFELKPSENRWASRSVVQNSPQIEAKISLKGESIDDAHWDYQLE